MWLTLLPAACVRPFAELLVATAKRPYPAIDSATALGDAAFSALFCAALESCGADAAMSAYVADVAVACAAYQGRDAAAAALRHLRKDVTQEGAARLLKRCAAALEPTAAWRPSAAGDRPVRPVVRVASTLLGEAAAESSLAADAACLLPEQAPLVLRWLAARLCGPEPALDRTEAFAEVAESLLASLVAAPLALREEAQRVVLCAPRAAQVFTHAALSAPQAEVLSVCLANVAAAACLLAPAGPPLLAAYFAAALAHLTAQVDAGGAASAVASLSALLIFLAPHCEEAAGLTAALGAVLRLPHAAFGPDRPVTALALRLLVLLSDVQDPALRCLPLAAQVTHARSHTHDALAHSRTHNNHTHTHSSFAQHRCVCVLSLCAHSAQRHGGRAVCAVP